VALSVETDGHVHLRLGAPSQGQSHRTTFAQIVADELGVGLDDVTVLAGDTDLVRYSIGTFASRAGVVAGSATLEAARAVRGKALAIAATMLEASGADLVLGEGRVHVKG